MLQATSGADLRREPAEYTISHSIWFALGVAYAQHGLYLIPDMVVTGHERDKASGIELIRLRTKDLRPFDVEHWASMVEKLLKPLGFIVYKQLQFLVIEIPTGRKVRLEDVTESSQPTEGVK
jgi:hypothetical protein